MFKENCCILISRNGKLLRRTALQIPIKSTRLSKYWKIQPVKRQNWSVTRAESSPSYHFYQIFTWWTHTKRTELSKIQTLSSRTWIEALNHSPQEKKSKRRDGSDRRPSHLHGTRTPRPRSPCLTAGTWACTGPKCWQIWAQIEPSAGQLGFARIERLQGNAGGGSAWARGLLFWIFLGLSPSPYPSSRPPAGRSSAQRSGSSSFPRRPVASPLHWPLGLLVCWVLIFVFACKLRPVVSAVPCRPSRPSTLIKLAWIYR